MQIKLAPTADAVHDRYLIPRVGTLFQIGTSLNGVGQVFTVLSELRDIPDEVRQRFERLWDASESVYPEDEVANQRE